MQIQISWLLLKPTDLDLHCLQRQDISGFRRTRVNLMKDSDLDLRKGYPYLCTCHFPHYTLNKFILAHVMYQWIGLLLAEQSRSLGSKPCYKWKKKLQETCAKCGYCRKNLKTCDNTSSICVHVLVLPEVV